MLLSVFSFGRIYWRIVFFTIKTAEIKCFHYLHLKIIRNFKTMLFELDFLFYRNFNVFLSVNSFTFIHFSFSIFSVCGLRLNVFFHFQCVFCFNQYLRRSLCFTKKILQLFGMLGVWQVSVMGSKQTQAFTGAFSSSR